MKIKGIIDEDFINYKKPSMVIEFPYCDLKCDKDCGMPVCQNSPLLKQPDIEVDCDTLLQRYINNAITKAIVLQGMEPIDSFRDVVKLISRLRIKYLCPDDVVIYTGYTEKEIDWQISMLSHVKNIIIKFGRYLPGQTSHKDKILGVELASDNQYAIKIS